MATSATAPPAPDVSRAARRARGGVAGLFFLNGVLYANLVPRLPEIKEALGLTNAALGAALAAMPAGALVAGLFAPLLIQRLGSGRVASFGLVGIALGVLLVPFTGSWLGFAAVMLVVGGIDALVDVGQNAHGFRVQRLYGRSIVNAFHGLWSVGAVVGGLMGSAAAGLAVALEVHLAVSAAVFGVAALACSRVLLPGPEDAERTPVDDTTPDAAEAAERDAPTGAAAAGGLPTADVAADVGRASTEAPTGAPAGRRRGRRARRRGRRARPSRRRGRATRRGRPRARPPAGRRPPGDGPCWCWPPSACWRCAARSSRTRAPRGAPSTSGPTWEPARSPAGWRSSRCRSP